METEGRTAAKLPSPRCAPSGVPLAPPAVAPARVPPNCPRTVLTLPRGLGPVTKRKEDPEGSSIRAGRTGLEPAASGVTGKLANTHEQSLRTLSDHASRNDDPQTPVMTPRGQNSRTEFEGAGEYLLDAALADQLLHVALRGLAERVARGMCVR